MITQLHDIHNSKSTNGSVETTNTDHHMSTNSTIKLTETVTEIKESCDVAVTILDDLLTYEKIEDGFLRLDLKLTNALLFMQQTVRPYIFQVFFIL